MKKKVFYWSPHLNPVGTVKSTLNSALSLTKYSNHYEVHMINVCGEWNSYEKFFSDNSINLISIASYDNYHFQQIRDSIKKNKNVICCVFSLFD